ncbi:alpha/beta hydrolase [Candidatus Saccharibacteria bacterium]|nr:alpha/beta hydrolase [Candidatus Saccharibacteria bacterium]
MKKAVFLHGTDGNPNDNWWSWLRKLLEENGYEIFAPTLPENHTPNKEVYDKFLKKSGWDFSDNLIIGHSSGATTALNLLTSDWFPKVKATVLLGVFLNENLLESVSWHDPGQFNNLFKPEYDISVLKDKSNKYIFVHGDNDPYCDYEDAKKLARDLEADFITIYNGHHLWSTSGIKELPELAEALNSNDLL